MGCIFVCKNGVYENIWIQIILSINFNSMYICENFQANIIEYIKKSYNGKMYVCWSTVSHKCTLQFYSDMSMLMIILTLWLIRFFNPTLLHKVKKKIMKKIMC
jgi:hypothetical protein